MSQSATFASGDQVPADFRAAMRGVAATVTIVTACTGGRHHGMTTTSVTSLSMEPPSLLVCLHRRTLLHAMLLESHRFCVNVLRREQASHSAAFSGEVAPELRFDSGAWVRDPGTPAWLSDAQANLFCEREAAIPYGTHTIFLGAVSRVVLHGAPAPLIYHDAGYWVAAPAAAAA